MAYKRGRKGEVEVIDEKQIVAEEDLVIDAQFLIQEALTERGLTRTELADRAGISKARLSQLMRAEANPTLRTLARLFHALDDQLCLSRKGATTLLSKRTEDRRVEDRSGTSSEQALHGFVRCRS